MQPALCIWKFCAWEFNQPWIKHIWKRQTISESSKMQNLCLPHAKHYVCWARVNEAMRRHTLLWPACKHRVCANPMPFHTRDLGVVDLHMHEGPETIFPWRPRDNCTSRHCFLCFSHLAISFLNMDLCFSPLYAIISKSSAWRKVLAQQLTVEGMKGDGSGTQVTWSTQESGPFHHGKKSPESTREEVAFELGPMPPIFTHWSYKP